MKDKILSSLISISLTACLFSGHAIVQQFAFYAVFAMNLIAWLGVFVMKGLGEEVWRKVVSMPLLSWALTVASIAALVYSNHPALAASSLICSVMIYQGARGYIKKANAGEL